MQSIDVLRREHRDLESMLDGLEAAASRLRAGESVPADWLLSAVALFEGFGNSCHHAKEEQALFPLLAQYGLGPEISFVRALRAQHETDRAYLLEIKEEAERLAANDRTAGPRLAVVLREYVQLLKEHIRIEESYFDGLIGNTMSLADDVQLVEQFDALDRTWNDRRGDGERL
jgi:hemerythrin-like domain-containing protein